MEGGEDTDQASIELNEWGIPDWRNPEDYGDVKSWSFDRWRWEFFRRRDDLRKYFDKWAEETYQNDLRLSRSALGIDVILPDQPGFCASGNEDPRTKFGYLGVPNPRIGPQPAGAIKTVDSYSHFVDGSKQDIEYGLGRQIGGRLRLAGVFFTGSQYEFLKQTLFDDFPVRLESNEVALTFNLNDPLEPQLRDAKALLKNQQLERHGKLLQRRRHPLKWLGYLRTLDAREAGASWSEIASLHPSTKQTEQSARDIWKQARDLCFNF